jgi:predicted house-cleaning noncanonical NTP pyrophosphatase (MazG superfamily)
MPKFVFNKLVRDRIVSHIEQYGDKPQWRKLDQDQLRQALLNKLQEEAAELQFDDPDLLIELADVQEVLVTLIKAAGFTQQQVRLAQRQKRTKVGSFKQRIFIDWVETQKDSPWLGYYQRHSNKYPEFTPKVPLKP